MAEVSLKHIYKIYPAREGEKKVKAKRGKKAEGETKRRSGEYVAVKDFSMDISDGDFVVFVGPSGCGKSTTLRMIAGLEDISAGQLFVNGKLVNNVEPKDRDMAMVFQSYALYPHMTVYQNIAFSLKLRKIPEQQFEDAGKVKEEVKNPDGSVLTRPDAKLIKEAELTVNALTSELAGCEKAIAARARISSELEAAKAELAKVEDKLPKDGAKPQTEEEKQAATAAHNVKKLNEKLLRVIDETQYKAILEGKLEEAKKHLAKVSEEKVPVYTYRAKTPEELASANGAEATPVPLMAIDGKKIKEAATKVKNLKKEIRGLPEGEYRQGLIEKLSQLREELVYYATTPVEVYKYRHLIKEEIDEKVLWAARVLKIEELLDNKPAAMSGGQRQRVALGRAIVRNPQVMLLDEPLSNLDAKLRTTMRSEIVKLHNQLKTTFIYVTHDQIEAMTMGNKIVVMKLGVVQQIDSPTNLFDFPDNKFVAGFIGTPQMNFFDVTVKKAGKKLATTFENGETVEFDLAKLRKIEERYLDGQEHSLSLGIRGENISIGDKGLKTTLNMKEILGNTTQLFVNLTEGGKDYIACVSERNAYGSGDVIHLVFDQEHIHMFDNESELSVMGREYGND